MLYRLFRPPLLDLIVEGVCQVQIHLPPPPTPTQILDSFSTLDNSFQSVYLVLNIDMSLPQQYGIDISDPSQPLLVSKPKKKDIRARGGDDSPILLVPELCTRTGQLVGVH